MRVLLLTILLATIVFAASPAKTDSSVLQARDITTIPATAPTDTIVDTIYVIQSSGIPWNREHFNPERLVRHDTFDPALKVAYSYSLNLVAGDFGSFANQSFMAHFAYEFTPNLHLYANVGLGMPLFANINNGSRIAREDLLQGNVSVLIPDISLEYKPSENTYIRLSYVNERDSFKAYGLRRFFHNDRL